MSRRSSVDHVEGGMMENKSGGVREIAVEKDAIARVLGAVLPADIDWQHIRAASQAFVDALATLRAAHRRYAHDAEAKRIYDGWSDQSGWVPWVDQGNSDKQEEARRLAREGIAHPPQDPSS